MALLCAPIVAQQAAPATTATGAATESGPVLEAVNFYGLRRTDRAAAAAAARIEVGKNPDSLDRAAAEQRLRELEHVVDASVLWLQAPGSVRALVGVLEDGTPTLEHRAAPTGSVRLPAEWISTYDSLMAEGMNGLRKGQIGETAWRQLRRCSTKLACPSSASRSCSATRTSASPRPTSSCCVTRGRAHRTTCRCDRSAATAPVTLPLSSTLQVVM